MHYHKSKLLKTLNVLVDFLLILGVFFPGWSVARCIPNRRSFLHAGCLPVHATIDHLILPSWSRVIGRREVMPLYTFVRLNVN